MYTWKEKETRSALPLWKLNMDHFCNSGSSGIMPSSLPVLPTTFDQNLTKLLDSQQVLMERETRSNSLVSHYTPFISNSGNVRPLYPLPSGFTSDLHFPTILPHERLTNATSFASQSLNVGVSLPSTYSSYVGTFQASTNNLPKDPIDVNWCPDSVHGNLNYSDDVITGNSQIQGCSIVVSDENNKQTEWWSDIMNEDWKDILNDTTTAAKAVYSAAQSSPNNSVHQSLTHQPVPCHRNDLCVVTSPLSAATNVAAKPRTRWTPELHEHFVDAVNQLGGSEKATPKGILNIMKVEGLTIYHVKSHLQKFRSYRPDSTEGMLEKKTTQAEELPSLDLNTGMDFTEALRLQMEVQKRLHEQLEIQRNLQLKIEENGKYLKLMIEKQCKSNMDMLDAPSNVDEPTTNLTCSTAKTGRPEAGKIAAGSEIAEGFRNVGNKWKMPELPHSNGQETSTIAGSLPPPKHARVDDNGA